MGKAFTIGEALSAGWRGFKENSGLWIGVLAVMLVVHLFVSSFGVTNFDFETGEVHGYFIVELLGMIVNTVLSIGIIALAVKTARGEEKAFVELFTSCDSVKKLFFMIIGQILFAIAFLVGLILLIIPGFIALTAFFLVPYFIALDSKGPIEAFKLSAEKTKGHRLQIFSFFLVSLVILVVAVIPVGLGLIIASPVLMVASAYIYDQLTRVDISDSFSEQQPIVSAQMSEPTN